MLLPPPRAHLTPPSGWMNDPNGPIFWQGRWHLYYQYNPYACTWATPLWGHAVSEDLAHWRHLPVALRPDPDGPDADGCFSGCMVDDGAGSPLAVYTGVREQGGTLLQTTCLARASEDLTRLEQLAHNPVIGGPPEADATEGFRDPFVWREDGQWLQLVGSGSPTRGGVVYLYRSDDLHDWAYVGPLHRAPGEPGHPLDPGVMWECPQLVRSEAGDVLIISAHDDRDPTRHKVLGFAGHRTEGRLVERDRFLVDAGSACYAPAVYREPSGRTLLWGWVTEAQPDAATTAQGFSGAMTLPREVWVTETGRLASRPAEETRALRGQVRMKDTLTLAPGRSVLLDRDARYAWLDAELDADPTSVVTCTLLASPDGREATHLELDLPAGQVRLDRSAASLAEGVARTPEVAALPAHEGTLHLTVIIDATILEVFLGDTLALTSRVYPTLREATGLSLSVHGGALSARVHLTDLEAALV